MSIEKKLSSIPPRLFTADGTQFGVIKVADATGFKVKQHVAISATTLPNLQLQVKRVIGPDTIIVGEIPTKVGQSMMTNRKDLSAYTVLLGAYIYAEEQDKPQLKPDDIIQAAYDTEPTVALRNVLVDRYGDYYGDSNPLPIAFDGTISIGKVEVSGTNGNIIEPNSDGSINVDIVNATVATPYIENISAPLAGTEYSFAFPAKTVKFAIKVRDGLAKIQIAYIPGDSSLKYSTVNLGNSYQETMAIGGKTIYFQTNRANKIIELVYWVQT